MLKYINGGFKNCSTTTGTSLQSLYQQGFYQNICSLIWKHKLKTIKEHLRTILDPMWELVSKILKKRGVGIIQYIRINNACISKNNYVQSTEWQKSYLFWAYIKAQYTESGRINSLIKRWQQHIWQGIWNFTLKIKWTHNAVRIVTS